MKKRNQDSQINVKCMKEDLDMLKVKAAEMGFKDVSKYVRFLIYQNQLRDPDIRSSYMKIIYELRKIGNNINQIAMNENSFIFSDSDRVRLLEYMKVQNDLINDIHKSLEITR